MTTATIVMIATSTIMMTKTAMIVTVGSTAITTIVVDGVTTIIGIVPSITIIIVTPKFRSLLDCEFSSFYVLQRASEFTLADGSPPNF